MNSTADACPTGWAHESFYQERNDCTAPQAAIDGLLLLNVISFSLLLVASAVQSARIWRVIVLYRKSSSLGQQSLLIHLLTFATALVNVPWMIGRLVTRHDASDSERMRAFTYVHGNDVIRLMSWALPPACVLLSSALSAFQN